MQYVWQLLHTVCNIFWLWMWTLSGLINTRRRWGKPFSTWLPGTVSLGPCNICKTCSHKAKIKRSNSWMGCRKIIYRQIKLRVTVLKAAQFLGAWLCLTEIIFTPKFGSVNCDLLQTYVNPLHILESWSSKFNTALAFCGLHQPYFFLCVLW